MYIDVTLRFNTLGDVFDACDPIVKTFDVPDDAPFVEPFPIQIPKEIPTRYGWTFCGWALEPNADYVAWLPGATYYAEPYTTDTTLYGVWSREVTIVYDINEGTSKIPNQTFTMYSTPNGTEVQIYGDEPYCRGMNFSTWVFFYSNIVTYVEPAGIITVYDHHPSTIYLLSNFVYGEYLITYDAAGGENAPDPLLFKYDAIRYGGLRIASDVPSKSGYRFINWKIQGEETYIGAGEELCGDYLDLVLVAQWERIPVSSKIKIDNSWKDGMPYVKADGKWYRGVKIFRKVGNTWKAQYK